jgi:hypothetical protein
MLMFVNPEMVFTSLTTTLMSGQPLVVVGQANTRPYHSL